jgi:hypothetical protein
MIPVNVPKAQDAASRPDNNSSSTSETQKQTTSKDNQPPAPLVIKNLSKRSRSAPNVEVISVARSSSPIDITIKSKQISTDRPILSRLDTAVALQPKPVHLRSASVPIHPFVTAKPTPLRHKHYRASSKTESLEDKMDRWYSFNSHPPVSPHPAPQTPLPPIPTNILSPESIIETPLEPLDESPVLPKESSGPFSPVT